MNDIVWPAGEDCSGTCVQPVYTLQVEPASTPGISVQVTLQDGMAVTAANVPPASGALTDSVNVSGAYQSPVVAALSDSVKTLDAFVSPVVAALSDAVGVVDKYAPPVGAALTDMAGIVDQLTKASSMAPALIGGASGGAVGSLSLFIWKKKPRKRAKGQT